MSDFYVYMYLRSNESNNGGIGSPYYVGKGHGMRAFDKNRRSKPPTDHKNIIFVSKNMSEVDAHQLEILLIFRYGRIDNKTGCLANLTDGGEGLRGHKQSAETIEKRASKLRGKPRPDVLTKEIRDKISRTLKAKGCAPPLRGTGWNHSKETIAKLRLRRPHNKYNDDIVQTVISMRGQTQGAIAAHTGVCVNTIKRIEKDAGVKRTKPKMPEVTRKALQNANQGRSMDENTKCALAAGRKVRWDSAPIGPNGKRIMSMSGKPNGNKGKPWSDARRAALKGLQ
jgi:hypothetical protein